MLLAHYTEPHKHARAHGACFVHTQVGAELLAEAGNPPAPPADPQEVEAAARKVQACYRGHQARRAVAIRKLSMKRVRACVCVCFGRGAGGRRGGALVAVLVVGV
jgi:hypothetical protein